MPASIEIERTPPADHSLYRFCIPLPRADEFESKMAFHCAQYAPFSSIQNGIYKMDVKIYQSGKLVNSVLGSPLPIETILECNFSEFVPAQAEDALAIVEITHPVDHLIDPYVTHRHRNTGCMVSHPLVLFMGQEELGDWLGAVLENSLFWPHIVVEDKLESILLVANPYDHSLRYQVSIFGEGKTLYTSDVLRLTPHTSTALQIEELFPQLIAEKGSEKCLDYSVCISTQYAAKALFGIRHRETGYYSTIDHLHEYIFR